MKVVAYEVTAVRRDFRRIQRWFRKGTMQLVKASDLTPDKVAVLVGSNPRDLIVKPVHEAAPPPAPKPAPAPPAAETPAAPTAKGKPKENGK